MENLQTWNWKNFINSELEIRQALGYPPFKQIYQLTFKDRDQKKVEKITDKVYNQVQDCFKNNQEIELFEPYYGFIKKRGIFWYRHFLIKILPTEKNSIDLEKTFKKISTNLSIDPDPENIF